MFNSCDRACSCRTDYTVWSQSHWPAWNVEETLKLRNCKKNYTVLWQMTTKNTEGRHRWTPDASMHRLHICCTMRANGSFAAIRRNVEFFYLRNAEKWQRVICGTFRTRFSANYPLTTFRNPHSANYSRPQNVSEKHTLSPSLPQQTRIGRQTAHTSNAV